MQLEDMTRTCQCLSNPGARYMVRQVLVLVLVAAYACSRSCSGYKRNIKVNSFLSLLLARGTQAEGLLVLLAKWATCLSNSLVHHQSGIQAVSLAPKTQLVLSSWYVQQNLEACKFGGPGPLSSSNLKARACWNLLESIEMSCSLWDLSESNLPKTAVLKVLPTEESTPSAGLAAGTGIKSSCSNQVYQESLLRVSLLGGNGPRRRLTRAGAALNGPAIWKMGVVNSHEAFAAIIEQSTECCESKSKSAESYKQVMILSI